MLLNPQEIETISKIRLHAKIESSPDEIFRVLGNRTRLNMLKALLTGSSTIDELSDRLGISNSACRHHIKLLLQNGYIKQSQEMHASGKPQIVYSIGPSLQHVDFPQRRYLELAEGLAAYLRPLVGDSTFKEVISKMGESMGMDAAVDLQTRLHSELWTVSTFLEIFVKGHLNSIGAEPRISSSNTVSAHYRVTNCPYQEVAFHYPELICDTFEVGFHNGVSKVMRNVSIRRIKCAAKGNTCCEFAVEAIQPMQ